MNIDDVYLKFILCEKFEILVYDNPYWISFEHRTFPGWQFYYDYNGSKNRIAIEKKEIGLVVNFKVNEDSITWDEIRSPKLIKQRARKESTLKDIVLDLGMCFDKDVSEPIAILQGKCYEN